MGTLGGFPNPPALWLRRAKLAFAYAIMGSLRGFPPALWLRRAKLAFAHAIMGSLRGFPPPFGSRAGLPRDCQKSRPVLSDMAFCVPL